MRVRWINAGRGAALLIVAAVSMINVITTAQRVSPPPIDPPASMLDPIVRHEHRFASLRAYVKERGIQGTIGYVGDLPGADDDYFYAQFVLLPLILDVNPEPYEWAVAYLPTTSPESRLPAGWRIAENFGDGVFLLRKTAP